MPERLVASDPITLLSVVPELVGFEPRESLVLVAFCGKTSAGAFRVDLPPDAPQVPSPIGERSRSERDSAPGTNGRQLAAALLDSVRRLQRVDRLIPIVYTEASCADGPPHSGTVSEIRTAASARGIRTLDALYVAGDGWGSYTGEPRPRDELESTIGLRRLDPDVPELAPPPREAAKLPNVSERDRLRTATALAAVERTEPGVDPVWLAGYSADWRPEDVGPAASALLAGVLADPCTRDVLLYAWAWGSRAGRRAVRFQERFLRGGPIVDARFAAAFSGADALGRPDVESVEHAVELVRRVAAHLVETDRAPALSALAWLSWALGRSSVAGEYLLQARAADPSYGLAELLDAILSRGILPEWAFSGDPSSRDSAPRRAGAGHRRSS
ncbi:DUF4192 domain-containing protein [Planctomonas sp. JC2975]|uniref:DUF4192 family protein n=1 Tax=Planctomonas sp. JC2975 TaxID=2729626 RepID=UPI00147518A8|nr:DUF4192 family protein [Planctomonas sp. JC2975]NNC13213.1 DUF4192 domain-containing protein [Planctomonas sp. JC2975]